MIHKIIKWGAMVMVVLCGVATVLARIYAPEFVKKPLLVDVLIVNMCIAVLFYGFSDT